MKNCSKYIVYTNRYADGVLFFSLTTVSSGSRGENNLINSNKQCGIVVKSMSNTHAHAQLPQTVKVCYLDIYADRERQSK